MYKIVYCRSTVFPVKEFYVRSIDWNKISCMLYWGVYVKIYKDGKLIYAEVGND